MTEKIKNKTKSNHGNTLIELLMYMGIFIILLAILLEMFGSVIDQQLTTEATSSVQEDGQYILTRLTYDIQRAQSISVPANTGDTSSSLQLVINGTPFTYSTASNNLQIITSGNTDVLNGYDTTVSNLSFKRLGTSNSKPEITFTYIVTSKVIKHNNPETQTYTTTVGTR